jgi:hypothetical protein
VLKALQIKDAPIQDRERFVAALASFARRDSSARLDIADLVPGAVRRLVLFAPGTPSQVIEGNPAFRHSTPPEARWLPLIPDSTLLVLHYHHGLIEGVLLPVSSVPFDTSLYGRPWSSRDPLMPLNGRLTVVRR